MKISKKSSFKFSFYIYLLNYLLIFSIILLKYLDIYYTLMLIGDDQVSETNLIAQLIINFDPIFIYMFSIIPVTLFFIVNYYIKENIFFLIGLSIILLILTIYLTPVVQNSIDILNQL